MTAQQSDQGPQCPGPCGSGADSRCCDDRVCVYRKDSQFLEQNAYGNIGNTTGETQRQPRIQVGRFSKLFLAFTKEPIYKYNQNTRGSPFNNIAQICLYGRLFPVFEKRKRACVTSVKGDQGVNRMPRHNFIITQTAGSLWQNEERAAVSDEFMEDGRQPSVALYTTKHISPKQSHSSPFDLEHFC